MNFYFLRIYNLKIILLLIPLLVQLVQILLPVILLLQPFIRIVPQSNRHHHPLQQHILHHLQYHQHHSHQVILIGLFLQDLHHSLCFTIIITYIGSVFKIFLLNHHACFVRSP
jgi:hypothetical protein